MPKAARFDIFRPLTTERVRQITLHIVPSFHSRSMSWDTARGTRASSTGIPYFYSSCTALQDTDLVTISGEYVDCNWYGEQADNDWHRIHCDPFHSH